MMMMNRSVSSVFKHIAISAGGLRFDSRAGQSGHSVANVSSKLFAQALSRGDTTRYTLRQNTASLK